MKQQKTTVTWRCTDLEIQSIMRIRKEYRIYSNADLLRFLVDKEVEKILAKNKQISVNKQE